MIAIAVYCSPVSDATEVRAALAALNGWLE
jgi:hypothetical protein